jgi:hypothetical protein
VFHDFSKQGTRQKPVIGQKGFIKRNGDWVSSVCVYVCVVFKGNKLSTAFICFNRFQSSTSGIYPFVSLGRLGFGLHGIINKAASDPGRFSPL